MYMLASVLCGLHRSAISSTFASLGMSLSPYSRITPLRTPKSFVGSTSGLLR